LSNKRDNFLQNFGGIFSFQIVVAAFFSWFLYVFPFGSFNYELIRLAVPKAGFFVTYSPVFIALRQVSVLLAASIMVIYAINKYELPKVSYLVHTLAFIHLMIGVKSIFYQSYGGLVWFANIPVLYVIAFFCEIVVSRINRQQTRSLTLGVLLATGLTAFFHIDFGNMTGLTGLLSRHQFQYGNPNHAGVGLVSILMLFLSFDKNISFWKTLLTLGLILGVSALVVLTGSRTALTGLFIFIVLRYAKLSLLTSALLILAVALGLLYITFFSDIFVDRDNRISLWTRLFTHYSFSILAGADFEVQQGFVEGFYITVPYTLGLMGFLLLLVFGVFLLKNIYISYAVATRFKEIVNLGPFLIAFSWFSLFETVYLGVLTPNILILFFVIAWLRKSLRSIKAL
jgi:hypothetical protein